MVVKITPTWDQQFPDLQANPDLRFLFDLKKKDWVWVRNERLCKIEGFWNKLCYLFHYFSEKRLVRAEITRLIGLLNPQNLHQHQRVIKLVHKKLARIDPTLAKTIAMPTHDGLENLWYQFFPKGEGEDSLLEKLKKGSVQQGEIEALFSGPFLDELCNNSDTLQHFFFGLLAPLSYDRKKIPAAAIEKLKAAVTLPKENLPEGGTKMSANFEAKWTEGKLALLLGVKMPRPSSGSSGVRFLVDYQGKKLGVFKPWNQGPHGSRNQTWIYFLKKYFVKYFRDSDAFPHDEEYLVEQAAYRLACLFENGDAIPETFVVNLPRQRGWFGEKRGSLQLMAQGESLRNYLALEKADLLPRCLMAKVLRCPCLKKRIQQKLGFNEHWEPQTEQAQHFLKSYQFIMLQDFLTDQIDRHTDNLFIDPQTQTIAAIDNGAELSTHQATGFLSRRHKFEAADFDFASQPLDASLLKKAQEVFEHVDILQPYLSDVQTQKEEHAKEHAQERIDAMKLRFQILSHLQAPTVKDLAKISCDAVAFNRAQAESFS